MHKGAILAVLALVLTGCTSIESLVEACHAAQGRAVIVVNQEFTEVIGVRCD
jgi:hypothetical protein